MKRIIVVFWVLSLIFTVTANAQNASVDNDMSQDQAQAQSQSQAQNQANQQILALTMESGKAKVGFGPPADIMFPGLIGNYVTPKMPGPLYTQMSTLLYAKDIELNGYAIFSREEIESIAKNAENWLGNAPGIMTRFFGGSNLEAVDSIKVSLMQFPFADKNTGKDLYPEREKNLVLKGMIYSKSTADDETTLDILALALREAMDKGITDIRIMAEGTQVVARSNGVGVGTNVSGGYVNNDTSATAGNIIGGGGTGWSSSKAWHEQYPYLQMAAYVKSNK